MFILIHLFIYSFNQYLIFQFIHISIIDLFIYLFIYLSILHSLFI